MFITSSSAECSRRDPFLPVASPHRYPHAGAMGADYHEQLIKKRREPPRSVTLTCRRCDRLFKSQHEVRSHRAQYHNLYEDSSSPALSATPPAPAATPDTHPGGQAEQQNSSPPPPFFRSSKTPSPSSIPQAAPAGSNPRVSLNSNFKARDTGLQHTRTPIQHATSSSSPLPSESHPVRDRTPQTPGPGDASADMHIARLSLDETQHQLASAQALVLRRIETGSPSKKRPASSDAHDPRTAISRPSHKPARHKGEHRQQAPISSQTPVADEFQRPRASGTKAYGALPDDSSRQAQKGPPQKPGQTNEHFSDHLAMHNTAFETLPKAPSLSTLPDPPVMSHAAQLKREATSNIISPNQLLAEVRGLYRSLEEVEKRCIVLDKTHMSEQGRHNKLETKHWQALTGLHRTLLYEHHDFLLASQHPSAPPELKVLASERQIPFRMWKYAIHAYLELLRQHLPDSLEFMESFIYLSYQMMALLYETVPLFEDVWTECLGDLARYRMAIENNSSSVRQVWSEVARWWYSRASDRQPLVGRLYHHLGILARPDLPRQLFYYCKSLCCVQPFQNARHSLKAVFETSLSPQITKPNDILNVVDVLFVRTHKLIYETTSLDQAMSVSTEFVDRLDKTIPQMDKKWKEYGLFLAITNLAACFGYGAADNSLRRAIQPTERKAPGQGSITASRSEVWQDVAVKMLAITLEVLLRLDDKAVLPHIHVVIILLQTLCPVSNSCIEASRLLQKMPWGLIATRMNALASSKENLPDRIRKTFTNQCFIPHDYDDTPLMEDFSMRGLVWCKEYFPEKWFERKDRDELPHQEPASSDCSRSQRILWSAVQISMRSSFLHFDRDSGQFEASPVSDDLMRTDD
ncbi:hypothetical protein K461DRAFT_280656 [Myriangium duriaei CBS 260.36]|uniref:Nonsense-mediated mRNA decay factor n=1 Tax=Myriangium duriaei CBS 260.36 TaxID=1168546 RepID=A0A9P4ME25_9PEZI|nr:hypothetical protein K461DRAFT_280656 [Myriangium duriaei CBS 260.36]